VGLSGSEHQRHRSHFEKKPRRNEVQSFRNQSGNRRLLLTHTHLLQKLTVEKLVEVAPGVFQLRTRNNVLAGRAQPGQFVNIRVTDGHDPLWRRPLSVHDVDRRHDTVDFLFAVVGRGTRLLSQVQPGDHLDVLGPLGNTFPVFPQQSAVLVAGGLGVAPFLFFARQLAAAGVSTVLLYGVRKATQLVPTDAFEELGVLVKVATDDGSAGLPGTVADLLRRELRTQPEDAVVYTCGPLPAVRAVARVLAETPRRAYASLETRMACGIGACVGCAVRVRRRRPNDPTYKLVCKDGPIFDLEEVDLEA